MQIVRYSTTSKIIIHHQHDIIQEIAMLKQDSNEDEEPRCFADSFMKEMQRRERKGEDPGKNCSHEMLK